MVCPTRYWIVHSRWSFGTFASTIFLDGEVSTFHRICRHLSGRSLTSLAARSHLFGCTLAGEPLRTCCDIYVLRSKRVQRKTRPWMPLSMQRFFPNFVERVPNGFIVRLNPRVSR